MATGWRAVCWVDSVLRVYEGEGLWGSGEGGGHVGSACKPLRGEGQAKCGGNTGNPGASLTAHAHSPTHTHALLLPQVSGEDVAFSWLDFPTKVMCGVLGHCGRAPCCTWAPPFPLTQCAGATWHVHLKRGALIYHLAVAPLQEGSRSAAEQRKFQDVMGKLEEILLLLQPNAPNAVDLD